LNTTGWGVQASSQHKSLAPQIGEKTAANGDWRLANGGTAFLEGSAFALPKNFSIEHRTLNPALRNSKQLKLRLPMGLPSRSP
jgi:hypothetical protein